MHIVYCIMYTCVRSVVRMFYQNAVLISVTKTHDKSRQTSSIIGPIVNKYKTYILGHRLRVVNLFEAIIIKYYYYILILLLYTPFFTHSYFICKNSTDA